MALREEYRGKVEKGSGEKPDIEAFCSSIFSQHKRSVYRVGVNCNPSLHPVPAKILA